MLSIRKPIWPMSSPRSSTAIPCAVSTNSCPSPTSSPSPKGPWPDNDAYKIREYLDDPAHRDAYVGATRKEIEALLAEMERIRRKLGISPPATVVNLIDALR